jgi:hypothetical protein
MKFAFVPKAQYKIGQVILVHGKRAEVVSYAHTGRNIEVAMLEGKPERVVCICTDNQPIEGESK